MKKNFLFILVLMLLPLMAFSIESDNLVSAKQKLASLYKYANRYEDKTMEYEGTIPFVIDIDDPDSLADVNMEADLNRYLMLYRQGQTNTISIPREIYNPDIEVEIGTDAFYNKTNSTYYKVGENTRPIAFDNEALSDITDKYGRVSNNDFFYLAQFAVTNPHVEIKLLGNMPSTANTYGLNNPAQVMSGKYDIMVVMVPYWYSLIPNENGTIADEFYDQNYIDSISAITKMCFTGRVRLNSNTIIKDYITQKSNVIEYDGRKVDTLMVFENFEFPYSYKDLSYSYPTLSIEGATKTSTFKKGFMFGLCIDRVILKSKESGEEIVIDTETLVSFTKDQMATIILPTAPDPELGKYYRLDRREEGKIIFEEELAPEANTPYIIKPKKDFYIDLSALDLKNSQSNVVSVPGVSFIGSYVRGELYCPDGCYIDIIDRTPDCIEAPSYKDKNIIGALHAYLKVSWNDPYNPGGTRGGDVRKKLDIVLHDNPNGTTGMINNIQNPKSKIQDDAIYDLSGRRVNSKSKIQNSKLPKGIYIVNGKKVAIK